MDFNATQEELEAGRGYEALFVAAVFDTWTKHLTAGIGEGSHVLDVACGSGALSRRAYRAAGRSGRVAGVDPAPGMLAAAQEIEPGIEWTLGSADAIPFADAAFGHVLCQFGMMFFPDRAKAAREMLRVLKPGGRLGVSVWNTTAENGAYGDIIAVLDEHVGTAAGDALRLPYSLGNPDDVTGPLKDCGFTDIGVETRAEQARFPSSRTMVEAELRGWLPLFGINLNEDKIADVLAKSDERLEKYAVASGEAVFPTSAHIVTARKPQ